MSAPNPFDDRTPMPADVLPEPELDVASLNVSRVGSGTIMTSYDPATNEGKRGIYRARVGREFDAKNPPSWPFAVEHVVTWPVSREDEETGEVSQWTAACLISPDGARLRFASIGIITSIHALVEQFGRPPWRPPLKVKLSVGPGKRGGSYYTLDLAD